MYNYEKRRKGNEPRPTARGYENMFMTIRRAREQLKFWEYHGALEKPIPEQHKELVNFVIKKANEKTMFERLFKRF